MATKPSLVPTWNSGGANNVEPSSGQKASGWTVNQIPTSSYFNWLGKLAGEWLQYLSDGALTGAHTFASTVGVTGALNAGAAVNATGLVTASAGVVAGANQHVVVSGSGRHKHGEMSIAIPASAAIVTSGSAQINGSRVFTSGAAEAAFPIMLPVGARITGYRAIVDNQNNNSFGIDLMRTNVSTQVATTTYSDGGFAANGIVSHVVTGLTLLIESGRQFFFLFTIPLGGSSVYLIEVYYDHP